MANIILIAIVIVAVVKTISDYRYFKKQHINFKHRKLVRVCKNACKYNDKSR